MSATDDARRAYVALKRRNMRAKKRAARDAAIIDGRRERRHDLRGEHPPTVGTLANTWPGVRPTTER